MVLRETGTILLMTTVMRMPIKDGRLRVKRETIPTKYLHGTATRPNIQPVKCLSGSLKMQPNFQKLS